MNLNQLHYFSKTGGSGALHKSCGRVKDFSAELKSCDWEPREGTWNKAF